MQKITQNDLNLVKNGDPVNAQTLNKTIISLLQELGDLQNQNSVNKGQLQEKSVTWDTIDDNNILEQHLRDDSISQSKLQDNSVIQGKLDNESVFEENIRAQAVTEQKIQNDSVNNNQLKTNSVSTIKIQDAQVTVEKLQGNSVSTDKIKDKAVTLDKFQDQPPESILARQSSIAGEPQFITKEQLKDMLEIDDMNSIVIGEEEGNIISIPSFGIGQGSEMYLKVIRDIEYPEDEATEYMHDQEIPEDQNYYYDYQDLTELQGGMYQIHREHPQNPLNQNQTLIITRHKEGSQTLNIQGVQTPEMKIQVWTGSSLTWQDPVAVPQIVTDFDEAENATEKTVQASLFFTEISTIKSDIQNIDIPEVVTDFDEAENQNEKTVQASLFHSKISELEGMIQSLTSRIVALEDASQP